MKWSNHFKWWIFLFLIVSIFSVSSSYADLQTPVLAKYNPYGGHLQYSWFINDSLFLNSNGGFLQINSSKIVTNPMTTDLQMAEFNILNGTNVTADRFIFDETHYISHTSSNGLWEGVFIRSIPEPLNQLLFGVCGNGTFNNESICNPRSWVQNSDVGSASGVSGSFMVVSRGLIQNGTNITNCSANGAEKIDCDDADVFIGDDLEVGNDVWIKNALGNWVFLSRHLETNARFLNNLLLNKLNGSVSGNILSFQEVNNETIIHNIGANETILGVTNGTVTLIEGTNSSPILNYVYYDTPGSANIVASSTSAKGIDHADIAKILLGANYTYAGHINRKSEDTALHNILDRFFKQGSLYSSGFTPNATSTNVSITGPGSMTILVDPHTHTGNLSSNDFFLVLNNGSFVQCSDIQCFTEYGDSGVIANNKELNIIWSFVHNDADEPRLLATVQNTPPTEFGSTAEAEADNRYTVFFNTIDDLDKYSLPILRTVIRRSSGVNTQQVLSNGLYYLDVRGTTKATGAGGASDADTTYTNASPISLTGTVFGLSACPNDEFYIYNVTSSAWECGSAGTGDITAINTNGPYLSGGASSGDISLLFNETKGNLSYINSDGDTMTGNLTMENVSIIISSNHKTCYNENCSVWICYDETSKNFTFNNNDPSVTC